jgi:hypothetical protein
MTKESRLLALSNTSSQTPPSAPITLVVMAEECQWLCHIIGNLMREVSRR